MDGGGNLLFFEHWGNSETAVLIILCGYERNDGLPVIVEKIGDKNMGRGSKTGRRGQKKEGVRGKHKEGDQTRSGGGGEGSKERCPQAMTDKVESAGVPKEVSSKKARSRGLGAKEALFHL